MKELKFKAWDKVKKQMSILQAVSFDMQSSAPFAVNVPHRSWEPIGKFELIQWTGLVDERGIDVYEGDWVKIQSILYKVVWNQTRACFELVEPIHLSTCNICDVASGLIMGNQFQNPELYVK